jgi:plasmid stabilization system protein ParE
MRKVIFLALAQNELDDMFESLEYQEKNQGYRFILEIERMLAVIKSYPSLWRKLSKHTHKCFIQGFPHAIIYEYTDNTILVVGIMSLHKKPIHWASKSVSEYATCRISSLPDTLYTR